VLRRKKSQRTCLRVKTATIITMTMVMTRLRMTAVLAAFSTALPSLETNLTIEVVGVVAVKCANRLNRRTLTRLASNQVRISAIRTMVEGVAGEVAVIEVETI